MATLPSLLSTFARVKGSGKTERFVNLVSGEQISRRQYDKIRRASQGSNILSNEALAKINKAIEPDEQLARPARGRTSARKLAPVIKADVIKARKELQAQQEETAKSIKEQRLIDRRIEAMKRKKVRVKKFSGRLLKPGRQAVRIAFNTWEEYVELYEAAEQSGIVFSYGMGIQGYDANLGVPRDATIFRMDAFSGLIDEDTFYSEMEGFIETHSYFIALNYYMHIHYSAAFVKKRATQKR